MANTEKLKIVTVDGRRAIGTYENVFIVIWRGVPHENDMRRARLITLDLIRTHGTIGFLNILEEHTPQPTAEVRKASYELLKDCKNDVLKWVFIVEGEGVRLALVRAVMNALKFAFGLILSTEYPTNVKAGTALLVSEMEKSGHRHGSLTARNLFDAVEQLREELNKSSSLLRAV